MKVKLADRIGFCFGVKRAVNMAEGAIIKRRGRIYSIGPIIHSPQVVKRLKAKGLEVCRDLKGIKDGDTIVIRSHGLLPELVEKARAKGIDLIDATCPFVKTAQGLAGRLSKEGYLVIVVGDKKHPEVRGIVGCTGGKAVVIENEKQAQGFTHTAKKIGVIAQTTQSRENYSKVTKKLIQKNIGRLGRSFGELRIFDTICKDTLNRQSSAKRIARSCDCMLVLGGAMSANSKRLAQTCKALQKATYHIEEAKHIKPAWLKGAAKIAIASGASTPDWIIDEVVENLKKGEWQHNGRRTKRNKSSRKTRRRSKK